MKKILILLILILAFSLSFFACALPQYTCTIKLDLSSAGGQPDHEHNFIIGSNLLVADGDVYHDEIAYDVVVDKVLDGDMDTGTMDLGYDASVTKDWAVLYLDGSVVVDHLPLIGTGDENNQYKFEADKTYVITAYSIQEE